MPEMTRYRTIVADPPWHFPQKWASITHGGKGSRIEKSLPYKTMTPNQISEIPVQAMADEHCRLFLWTTNRHLPVALSVVGAWGFQYAQTLVWRKTGNPSPFAGGGIAPVHHEFLLVAKRGSPEVCGHLKSSVLEAPAAVFGHSVKPECFIDHIENISPGPYLELFARRARFGWDYYGDESLGTARVGGAAS